MSNPVKPTHPGTNRTGIATSPIESKKAIDGARAATATPTHDGAALAAERISWSRQVAPVGTMPPPLTVKGVVKSAVQAVKGNHPLVFVNLLAERLAFERTGTRLYEALLPKLEAAHAHPGGPTRDVVELIRDEELKHAAWLANAIESLGADPTAMTPGADITAVASMGLVQVLTDPRVTLTEALQAILIAELTDNDGWLTLVDVAARLGHDEMAEQFQEALAEEEEHLARVRSWLAASIDTQAGLEPRDAAGAGTPATP
jgi:rubrerythrin